MAGARWIGNRSKSMTDTRPYCNIDFDGGPIPEDIREHYSPPYRWSRKIGIYDRNKNAAVAWKCTDCGEEWKA